jgi:hypothetical protein
MEIFVKSRDHGTLVCTLDETSSVKDLKEYIAANYDIPVNYQHIVYAGKKMS